jgi:riboflavin kinase/FMN adenylyltransferase
MNIFYLGKDKLVKEPHLSLCLGNFDGMHRGHQSLFLMAKEKSEGPVGALLFDKNPADILENGKSHHILTSLEDKIRFLNSFGFDDVYIASISPSFFALSPANFVEEILKPISPSQLVVGEDYSFGYMAKGKAQDLAGYYKTIVCPLLKDSTGKISSQEIIASIKEGKIEEANHDLGRNYEIVGKVGHGLQNGRKIGFPTANLVLSIPYVLPKDGVYSGVGYSRGLVYKALINIGLNPTVGILKHPSIECYLEGLNHEIYDETLYIDFSSRLRDEIKFASLDELKKQIQKDLSSL